MVHSVMCMLLKPEDLSSGPHNPIPKVNKVATYL